MITFKRAYDWIDERLNVTPLWRDVADHDVPAHVNPESKCRGIPKNGNLQSTAQVKQVVDWLVKQKNSCK